MSNQLPPSNFGAGATYGGQPPWPPHQPPPPDQPRGKRWLWIPAVLLVCSALLATFTWVVWRDRYGDDRSTAGSTPDQNPPPPLMLILDGSGSMTTDDAPGPRIDAAKQAALTLIDSLPDTTEMGLMTYGTKIGAAETDRDAGCRDVTVLAPLERLDRDRITALVNDIEPSGYTPIALALREAAGGLPAADEPTSIVLVSDGEDTCGAPPCPVAAELRSQYPQLTISTIGFRTDGPASAQLACIAQAAGGLFVGADNAEQLAARLIAVQNVDTAKTALTADGRDDIELGQSLDDIRNSHNDFPDGARSGEVVIVYRDCDFGFVDGVLDYIAPHDGGRTIDGVGAGSDVGEMQKFYGSPLDQSDNGDGTHDVIFAADEDGSGAYRTRVKGYSEMGGAVSGVVERIVLCRCRPETSNDPFGGAARADAGIYEYLSWGGPPMVHFPDTASFTTPSGNITCHWYNDDPSFPLICEIAERNTAPTSRPASCGEGPGWITTYVEVSAEGPIDGYCAGGIMVPPEANVLPYDTALIAGSYGCVSRESGVTCVYLPTGRGFTVSRDQFTAF